MQQSTDARVRLTVDEMLTASWMHLDSGVDLQALRRDDCGRVTSISGYTEWVTLGSPVITLGWDWCIRPLGVPEIWMRVDTPRSNVMLVDRLQRDVGWTRNQQLLGAFVDALPWVECARASLDRCYR